MTQHPILKTVEAPVDLRSDDDSDDLFQILTIDGGGLKGMFAAVALAAFEEDFNTRIVDHFDLIAGTSTGGIIALALACGVSPHDVFDLYEQNARRIFPRRPFGGFGRRLFKPCNPKPLRDVVESVVGTRLLGDSPVRLAVPSFDLTTNNVHLFRTPHDEKLRRDHRDLMVDVAMATTAAPTYFPVHEMRGLRLVDGGVWANNPTMLAMVEAIHRCKIPPHKVRILNIGCTTDIGYRPDRLNRGGMVAWRNDVAPTLLTGQALASVNHARMIVGKENIVRIDVSVRAGIHRLDAVKVSHLRGHAEAISRTLSDDVAPFMRHVAKPYFNHARKEIST